MSNDTQQKFDALSSAPVISTNDDKELENITVANEAMREVFLCVALDMKELFPVKWTNEVFHKFLAIGIESP